MIILGVLRMVTNPIVWLLTEASLFPIARFYNNLWKGFINKDSGFLFRWFILGFLIFCAVVNLYLIQATVVAITLLYYDESKEEHSEFMLWALEVNDGMNEAIPGMWGFFQDVIYWIADGLIWFWEKVIDGIYIEGFKKVFASIGRFFKNIFGRRERNDD